MVERCAFHARELGKALETQTQADRVITAVCNYDLIPATKALMEAMGFDVGNATFPMTRYNAEEKAAIVADARAAGLNI